MADATTRVTAVTTTPQQMGGNVAFGSMWNVLSSESLVSTGVVESVGNGGSTSSVGIPLAQGSYFGLWIQAAGTTGTSTGIPNYTVSVLQSYNDTAANYVVPDPDTLLGSAASTGVTITDFNAHIITLTPAPMPLTRIRVTNATTSTGSVTLNSYLWAIK